MNVKEPVQDGCIVRVGIELSSDEIQPKIDETFESTRKSASLPGFRPGKVPTSVLKQRIGKQVREEA
ncbi:MAG TPA: trigger factor, partial [Bacteroidetes bacterium]|nr:trigger factor [Bacteroidota bacterium]HEX05309.1 trigger factor [Bacteroidota bacterium]